MKYFIRFVLACVMVLSAVPFVAAQQPATPVVRIGDWVEVGNEVFMNIIATTEVRYRTTQNYDFEKRIQDRVASRDNLSTVPHGGEIDGMIAETRLGVDMRYQKSLQLQVLFEQQSVFDGNLIDNTRGQSPGCGNPGNPPCRAGFAGPAQENNYVNLERFWIDYKFPGTPFRMRVGADIWATDAAGIVSDDDPRFALFYDGGAFQAYAAAVVQLESSRLGLTNDNDYIYYTFGGAFNFKPHRLAVDVAWFRDRFSGAQGQSITGATEPNTQFGQEHDTVMISPSWKGSFGPISAMVQGSLHIGTAQGAAVAGRPELDVWSWAGVGYLEAKLGMITPFVAIIYGSGDDNPFDTDLKGFTVPHREITIMATGFLDTFDTSSSFGERATAAPARAAFAGAAQFRHSVGNPFSDRIGNRSHVNALGIPVITSTLSNPGVLMPMAGLKIDVMKGHDVNLWWIWTRFDETETVRVAALQAGVPRRRARFDQSLTHEVSLVYIWTLNPHFDIRLSGNVVIPLDGAKDIAATQDCGGRRCDGDDLALRGEARLRARF